MMIPPAALGPFLVVNLLCACIALGVGFAAGVWFFGAKLARPAELERPKKPTPQPSEDSKRAAERASMAASRVADLAKNVACDVGDHAAKMKAISADLAGIDRQSTKANGAVFAALDQMLAANSELQQRLEKAEKQLATQAAEIRAHESEARTDSLTAIANRRAFDDELKRRHSEWERKQSPCTLLLLDIDFFKKFNDTHGHQVGDEVLRSVAKVLKAQCRDMDLPCRYGGEEFGVILPATDAASAGKVAERIRLAVQDSTTVHGDQSLKVTCSVGISEFRDGDEIDHLIRRADEGLYASKKAGRNCGHWHNGTRCVPIAGPFDEPAEAAADLASVEATNSKKIKPATSGRITATGTFIHILKRRVTESHRFGVPLSVLHLKVEEYDVMVHKYGPVIAKQILDVAEPVLTKTLREMDSLARLENGEFVAMLPGQTPAEAGQTAKKLANATANCVFPVFDRELHFRCQHGIAQLKPNETAQELLSRARQAVDAPPPSRKAVEV